MVNFEQAIYTATLLRVTMHSNKETKILQGNMLFRLPYFWPALSLLCVNVHINEIHINEVLYD